MVLAANHSNQAEDAMMHRAVTDFNRKRMAMDEFIVVPAFYGS